MSQEKDKGLFKWLLWIRPLLRLLRGLRGSPQEIAGGFSLGLFIAFTPTVGVQIVAAIFLATFFKLSRPAAIISVMVTNPVTIPPLFTFNYWVGSLFFEGPTVRQVYGHFIRIAAEMAMLDVWELGAQIKAFAQTGQDMLVPLLFGSMLVATVVAALSYVFLVRFFWFLKLRRERKIQLKLSRQEKEKSSSDSG